MLAFRLAALHALANLHLAVSAVKVFNDASFEHDTQASTGSTTGDWLVVFGEANCQKCEEMVEEMDRIEEDLKQAYALPARVEKKDSKALWKRFKIAKTPTVLLFSHRKMYTYGGGADGLLEFVTGDRGQGVPVPAEPSFFEQLFDKFFGKSDEL
eukprot:TRINITY_DN26278_c0_g1_i1.p3 TRINITY_DN26278_c0_g1~~TRINITY_DN26278_c0_g1_i1.p3  ORF type:complete len:155 (-),score=47.63 TRINITY_DN26278_c0_g1_i1:32-496(-)